MTSDRDIADETEPERDDSPQERYVLRLYVAGTTHKSKRAIANIERLCEEHLKGRYDLEVVDLYKQPALAQGEQIIAVPTLIKQLPLPLRRLIGDLSDPDHLIVGLDLVSRDNE